MSYEEILRTLAIEYHNDKDIDELVSNSLYFWDDEIDRYNSESSFYKEEGIKWSDITNELNGWGYFKEYQIYINFNIFAE